MRFFFFLSILFLTACSTAAPKIFMKKADLLDMQVNWRTNPKYRIEITPAVRKELKDRMPEFQRAWNHADQLGILRIGEEIAVKKYERKEYTSWLTLSGLIPMGRPLIVDMNAYLENGTKPYPTLPNTSFIVMTHHEVLHFLVENIEGPTLNQFSPLIRKYKAEGTNVKVHLHLMAVQKSTYEKMGKFGKILMKKTDHMYNEIIKGDYKRAWEIVNIEGADAFNKELRAFNQKKSSK